MHPPYWDIVKFSENPNDLSNCDSINEFLDSFGKVIDNSLSVLEKNRYCAVVIGDKYANSQVIPPWVLLHEFDDGKRVAFESYFS